MESKDETDAPARVDARYTTHLRARLLLDALRTAADRIEAAGAEPAAEHTQLIDSLWAAYTGRKGGKLLAETLMGGLQVATIDIVPSESGANVEIARRIGVLQKHLRDAGLPSLLSDVDAEKLRELLVAWPDTTPGRTKTSKWTLLADVLRSLGIEPPMEESLRRDAQRLAKRGPGGQAP